MWVIEPKLSCEFPILEVFVNCGLILLEGERAAWVSVCASVALSNRVGGIKRGGGGEKRKENKRKTREETRISFIALQGTKGF